MGSILDNNSIALLRRLSRGGWATPGDLAAATGIGSFEVAARIKALEHSSVIGRFRAVPFVPSLVGGAWGRYIIRLHKLDLATEDQLINSLSALEESIHNACFFTKRLPHTSFFCFSRTKEELKLVARGAGVEDEPLLVREYNFPFPVPLSAEERMLLRAINSTGEAMPSALSNYVNKPLFWVESKLKRLILHSDNPQGVAVLRTSICWFRIDNFIHVHVMLPVSAKPYLQNIFKNREWAVLSWPGETQETIAVEADFKGWGDFAEWKELCELHGFEPGGFAMFAEERIHGKGFEY